MAHIEPYLTGLGRARDSLAIRMSKEKIAGSKKKYHITQVLNRSLKTLVVIPS